MNLGDTDLLYLYLLQSHFTQFVFLGGLPSLRKVTRPCKQLEMSYLLFWHMQRENMLKEFDSMQLIHALIHL